MLDAFAHAARGYDRSEVAARQFVAVLRSATRRSLAGGLRALRGPFPRDREHEEVQLRALSDARIATGDMFG